MNKVGNGENVSPFYQQGAGEPFPTAPHEPVASASTPDTAQLTLQVLRDRGAQALDTAGSPPISGANLRSLQTTCDDELRSSLTCRSSDLFKLATTNHTEPIPACGDLTAADVDVLLPNNQTQPIHVRSRHVPALPPSPYKHNILCWLAGHFSKSFKTACNILLALALALAPTLDDNDGDADDEDGDAERIAHSI